MSYSLGVRWTGAPPTVTSRRSRSIRIGPCSRIARPAGRAPPARRRAARIRARSSLTPNGLVRKSSAPRSSAWTLLSSSPCAERTMIGRSSCAPGGWSADVQAAQVRQHEVQQHEVRVSPVEQLQPLLSRRRQDRLEAVAAQDRPEGPCDLRLVVDDQDARASSCVSPGPDRIGAGQLGDEARARYASPTVAIEDERGIAARRLLNPDLPAVALDEATAHRQAEARASASASRYSRR